MPVVISDEILKAAKLSERDVLIEMACRWYDAGRLDKPSAVKLAGLTRTEFEAELLKRGLPWKRLDYAIEDDVKRWNRSAPRRPDDYSRRL